jgi:hypothetical protein
MALASKHLAVFQPHHARATTPRGTCTAVEGLDAETLRGFQLAGKLFSLTSFFIEPKGAALVLLREYGSAACKSAKSSSSMLLKQFESATMIGEKQRCDEGR